jgi:hypothetical protein
MPGYTAPTYSAFGRNEYLKHSRSGATFESYTVAASTIPADADGNKVLQAGTVLAKITSGGDSGKVGPFSATATDGRQTAGNIVGVCDSFFPYQLNDFDREAAVLVVGYVDPTRCYEYTAAEVAPGTLGLAAGTITSLTTRSAARDIKAA